MGFFSNNHSCEICMYFEASSFFSTKCSCNNPNLKTGLFGINKKEFSEREAKASNSCRYFSEK